VSEFLGLPDAGAVGLPRLVLPPELRQHLPEPQVRVALVLPSRSPGAGSEVSVVGMMPSAIVRHELLRIPYA
jgi:hypothetical protein